MPSLDQKQDEKRHELKTGTFFSGERKVNNNESLHQVGSFPETLECGLDGKPLYQNARKDVSLGPLTAFSAARGFTKGRILGTTNSSDGATEIQPYTTWPHVRKIGGSHCVFALHTYYVSGIVPNTLPSLCHSVSCDVSSVIFVLLRRASRLRGISNLHRSNQLVSSLRQGLCHFHPLELNTILSTH